MHGDDMQNAAVATAEVQYIRSIFACFAAANETFVDNWKNAFTQLNSGFAESCSERL